MDSMTNSFMLDIIRNAAENSPFLLLLYFISRSLVNNAGRWFERNIDRLVNAVNGSGCMMRSTNGHSFRKDDLESFQRRLDTLEQKIDRLIINLGATS